MNTTTETTRAARERAKVLSAAAAAGRVDDDDAAASAVTELLSDRSLRGVDHADLFAGVPAIAEQVEAVSARLGVPSTAASLLALSMLSIGCLDRVRVRIDEPNRARPWTCPLHVWTLSELKSGKGKSELLREMGQPAANRFARRLAAAWSQVELADEDRRAQADKRLKSAVEADRLAARAVCKAPKLCAPAPMLDQVTPEEYGWRSLLSGFTWIATSEGREFFDNFVFGREAAAIGDLVKSFSGDAGSRATRKDSREGNLPLFAEFHSVVALLCQPGNLTPAQSGYRQRLADAASRGLLARFVVGRRVGAAPKSTRSPEDLQRVERAYEALLERFFVAPEVKVGPHLGLETHPCAPRDSEGRFAGRFVAITGEAAARLIAFQKGRKLDADRDDDEQDPVVALLSRAGEVAIRIAGLLALARAGGLPALGADVSVTDDEAARAIRFVEQVHIPHGLSLLEQTTAGEVEALGVKVLRTLAEAPKPTTLAVFKNSPARRWPELRGRALRDKCPLQTVFEDLVKRSLVTAHETPRSVLYELSPAGRRAVAELARKGAA